MTAADVRPVGECDWCGRTAKLIPNRGEQVCSTCAFDEIDRDARARLYTDDGFAYVTPRKAR